MITKAVLYATLALSTALLLDVLPASVQAQSLAASDAATQSAQAKLAAATAAQNAGRKKYPVTREDIVVAMPVDQAHLTVAHASRVWRKVIVLPQMLTSGLHALCPAVAYIDTLTLGPSTCFVLHCSTACIVLPCKPGLSCLYIHHTVHHHCSSCFLLEVSVL